MTQKEIKIRGGVSIIFERVILFTDDREHLLSIASSIGDSDDYTFDYFLTKDDARKFRDAIDEWLNGGENKE